MIDEITIKGYKSIRSQTVKLHPINVIIGANGVGKTNFISAFELMRNIYEQQLQSYVLRKGGANMLLYGGRKHTEEIFISLELNNARNKYDVCLAESQDRLYIQEAKTQFYNGIWHPQLCDINKTEATIRNSRSGQAFYVGPLLEEFQIYHFHDTSDTAPMKTFSDVYQNRRLMDDGSNIASFLFYLKEKQFKHFKRIERMVASVSPFFERFELNPNPSADGKVRLEWKQKDVDDFVFNAYQLSDGTLRFICLATLLMQPNPPKTILIDEPELGLHPKAINAFCEMVKTASERSQIIVSTQSVNVVDNFSPNDIITAQQENNATVFHRLNAEKLKDWLGEYSIGELWEMNAITNGYE